MSYMKKWKIEVTNDRGFSTRYYFTREQWKLMFSLLEYIDTQNEVGSRDK